MTGTVRADGQPIDRPEERWIDASLDQLRALRGWLDREGYSPAFANHLIGALLARDFTALSTDTRARYRAVLREHGGPRAPRPQKGVARSADNPRDVLRYVNPARAPALALLAA